MNKDLMIYAKFDVYNRNKHRIRYCYELITLDIKN